MTRRVVEVLEEGVRRELRCSRGSVRQIVVGKEEIDGAARFAVSVH